MSSPRGEKKNKLVSFDVKGTRRERLLWFWTLSVLVVRPEAKVREGVLGGSV